MRLFVSYRRDDSAGWAGRLHDALVARRDYEVFRDIEGIDFGDDFLTQIEKHLEWCDVVVALIGPQWLTVTRDGVRRLDHPDDVVRHELEGALARGRPIIPVLLERATMPRPNELPPSIAAIATRRALNATDESWHATVDDLVDVLDGRAGQVGRPRRDPVRAAALAPAVAATGEPTTEPPTGAVTFLFTDIEGSTRAWEQNETTMAAAISRHNELVRGTFERFGGFVFKDRGDGFAAAFADPTTAVEAAAEAQRAVVEGTWPGDIELKIRCALHTGTSRLDGGDYHGRPLNRVARLVDVGHGGQTLLSDATRGLLGEHFPDGLSVVDLGEHRLKDVPEPIRVWQLDVRGLPNRFPGLRSLGQVTVRTNVPARLPALLGRDGELADVVAMLHDAAVVTLVGPGGVGKTSLALHAAPAVLDEQPDGVWFVDLTPAADRDQVVGAIDRTLGITDEQSDDPLDALVEACSARTMLVILDNCEHVVDDVAEVVDTITASAPNVRVLATSREPLQLAVEHQYPIEPLSTGEASTVDLGALAVAPAIELFLREAKRQRPRFELTAGNADTIATICRRLDGMPLAITLAAARVGEMPVESIAARLSERFGLLHERARRGDDPRHRTLRATIDWSWNLLEDHERAALARLSVFPSSFSFEAAEAVVDCDGAGVWSETGGALVTKSLLQMSDSGRYALLESIRAYASDRLEAMGVDVASQAFAAHRAWYLALARDAEPHMRTFDQQQWLDALRVEHDNFVVAIDRSIQSNDPVPGLGLATTLVDYWAFTGLRSFAVQALRSLLAAADDVTTASPAVRARALTDLAAHELRQGEYDNANAHCEAACALARELHDDALLARALVSNAYTERDDAPRSLANADEALTIARRLVTPALVAGALKARGFALAGLDDLEGSKACLEEERAVRASMGDAEGEAFALSNLADADLRTGDEPMARTRLETALSMLERCSSPTIEALARLNLGFVELGDGNRDAAKEQFARSMTLARRCGLQSDVDYAILGTALSEADAGTAAMLLAVADASIESRGETLQGMEAARRAEGLARLIDELGQAGFDAAQERGRRLPRNDAIALAAASQRPDRDRAEAPQPIP